MKSNCKSSPYQLKMDFENPVDSNSTSSSSSSSSSRDSRGSRGKPWPLVKLGDVCEIILGGTPSTSEPSYWGGGIPWITPGEMGKLTSKYVNSTVRTLTKEGLNIGSTLCPANSVILSTRAPIGYVYINTVPMSTNQGCKTLVPNSQILPEFLYHNLKGRTDELNSLGSGTTFKELSTKALASFKIPLPPLDVQREIVTRLETELSRIDDIIKELQRGLLLCGELRKAILKEAFE